MFFNNEVETGKVVDMTRDHHSTPGQRSKKIIAITVGFELPPRFKLRKELQQLEVLGQQFKIRKILQLDQRRQVFEQFEAIVDGDTIEDGDSLARQFLLLIAFRYVPVRGVPSALLREESQAIADSLFLRMKGDKHAAELLKSLTAAAARMLTSASDSMDRIGAPFTAPSLATASSLGEMLTMTGFQASGLHGGVVQDEDWGAGHQAFFLYQVLHTIDTAYSRFFGWRQATVWGIEEPESTLHRDLETRLAEQLRTWAHDESSRLQVFQTTHSPVFTMAADAGVWVDLPDAATKLQQVSIPSLTRRAETGGVSGWIHPALSFPWNPVVLVEGPIDESVLTHVAAVAGLDHLRFLTLPRLDDNEGGGGKDSMLKYLRHHRSVISNRPRGAPLIALFDWELSDQEVKQAQAAYGPMGDQYVVRMDSQHCHSRMSEEFKGIERFYPPEIVLAGHAEGEFIVGIGADDAPLSISSAQLASAKGPLRRRVTETRDLVKLAPLMKVVSDIDRAVTGGRWVQGEMEIQ